MLSLVFASLLHQTNLSYSLALALKGVAHNNHAIYDALIYSFHCVGEAVAEGQEE
jgi:hypothetical protein